MTLVLASRSPQRRAILQQLGIEFEVLPVEVQEFNTGDTVTAVRDNALRKARAGAALRPAATVLGVDTLVTIEGEIFGQPEDQIAAASMLKRLAGRTHEVISGLALITTSDTRVLHEATKVTFRALSDETIERYVATQEWRGRAGGYAIQGQGAALVRRIEGDYLNVVGLPVGAMLDLDSSLMLMQR